MNHIKDDLQLSSSYKRLILFHIKSYSTSHQWCRLYFRVAAMVLFRTILNYLAKNSKALLLSRWRAFFPKRVAIHPRHCFSQWCQTTDMFLLSWNSRIVVPSLPSWTKISLGQYSVLFSNSLFLRHSGFFWGEGVRQEQRCNVADCL